jgi:hypothetical protein
MNYLITNTQKQARVSKLVINRILTLLFFFCGKAVSSYAQATLVLNGAYMNISNSATLVVANPDTSAITYHSGSIISEGENNEVIWLTGSSTGTYLFPFGYSNTDYIPLQFTISTAGDSSGYISASTYRTGTWQNSAYLPSGVPNVNNASVGDASAYVVDRFWSIDASSYTSKPSLSNLMFTYVDAGNWEINGSNNIIENNLKAQRWNSTVGGWQASWINGTASTSANTVTVSTVSASDLFKWWTLVDNSTPLPVELVNFGGKCENKQIIINWTTASETNNDHFEIERSINGQDWKKIGTVAGAGNSLQKINYSFTDSEPVTGICYYRLRQTDFDGTTETSPIIAVESCGTEKFFSIYPNPASSEIYFNTNILMGEVKVYNCMGELVKSADLRTDRKMDLSFLSSGVYTLVLENDQSLTTHKVVLTH